MKYRAGFVSNSSSSSFIAVTDNKGPIPIRGTRNTLEDYGNRITSMKEWIDENWFEFTDDGCIEDQITEKYDENAVVAYQSMKEQLDKGREIISGVFSDDTGNNIEADLRGGEFERYIDKADAELIQYYE